MHVYRKQLRQCTIRHCILHIGGSQFSFYPCTCMSVCPYSAGAAADPEVGRRADHCRQAAGRGAGPRLPLHVPRGGGGVRLAARLRVPAATQHLSPRPQGVRLGRGQSADDRSRLYQGIGGSGSTCTCTCTCM